MPSIIQLIHPGSEKGPDSSSGDQTEWSVSEKHYRKFLESKGEYLENNKVKNGVLNFWGEWEPPSHVSTLNQNDIALNPKWLHKPYLPNTIPTTGELQNTDPFVFENEFKYLVCQQSRNYLKLKQTRLTQLAHLEKGSLILFGSVKYPRTPNAIYQLDTVFVVQDWIDYNPITNPISPTDISQFYFDAVASKLCVKPINPIELRLYTGATYENPTGGMYSFVPSILPRNDKVGFPRISLANSKYINPQLPQGFKAMQNLTLQEVSAFWEEIISVTRNAGCLEGLKFWI